MMVAAAEGDSPDLSPKAVIKALDSKNSQDKIDAYNAITSHLRADDYEDFSKALQGHVFTVAMVITNDILSDELELCMAALTALGCCLNEPDIVNAFSAEECSHMLKNLCNLLLKTSYKHIATRALWCLVCQELPTGVLANELHTVLCAIEHIVNNEQCNHVTVEHEAVNAVIRLQEQIPKQLSVFATRWGKIVFTYITHPSPKIRDRALVALENGMPAFLQHQTEILKFLVPDLRKSILADMLKLMGHRHEIYMLKVWRFLLQILGKTIHHGGFINQLLPIAEYGFKCPLPEVRVAAFRAWQELINNFALDQDIVSDPKRVKLIMQVLRINNAKTEEIAVAKLDTWWHFMLKLDGKLSAYFDQVVVPLLHFCFGDCSQTSTEPATPSRKNSMLNGISTPTANRLVPGQFASPMTPKINVSSPGGTPQTTYKKIQLKGVEIIAQLLGKLPDDVNIPATVFSIEPLKFDVISAPVFFMKVAKHVIPSIRECIVTLGNEIQDGLLYHIWYCLVAQINNVMDENKKNVVEVVSSFLTSFQWIVLSESLDTKKTLKLFEAVSCLPQKALGSSAYHIGTADLMHGSAALYLIELLLNPNQVEAFTKEERFFTVLEKLVASGMTTRPTILGFCQSVLQLISKVADHLDNKELLWRLWSVVVNPLLEHVKESNEVNQGDALEHDFNCLYTALHLPAAHLLNKQLPQGTMKAMLKTWTDLYKTFSRLAAMVTNADANICCEELCDKIAGSLETDTLQDLAVVEPLTQMLLTVIDCVDFSSFSFKSHGPLSPTQWSKKKQKLLGNLHSFTRVLCLVLDAFHAVNGSSVPFTPKKESASLLTTGNNLLSILTKIFTQASVSSVIAALLAKLAAPVAQFFEGAKKKSASKFHSPATLQKLDKLWLDMCTCIQGRYDGGFDSELLLQVAPLLEATFLHPRRHIKDQTSLMWNATFAHAAPLTYPSSLVPVLSKVKEKTAILLPGWINTEIMTIEETPVSQMSQAGESQVAVPHLFKMPSPHKVHGSFLNKAVSPKPAASPVKAKASPANVRRKLPLFDGLKNDDFVVIKQSPKKRRVLTEHQKEVFKQRSTIPTLYNDLDASQNRTLSSQFDLGDTQSESQMAPTPTEQIYQTMMATKKQKVSEKESNITEAIVEKELPILEKNKKENEGKEETNDNQVLARPSRRRKSVRFSTDKEEEKSATDESEVPTPVPVVESEKENSKIDAAESTMEEDDFATPPTTPVKSKDSELQGTSTQNESEIESSQSQIPKSPFSIFSSQDSPKRSSQSPSRKAGQSPSRKASHSPSRKSNASRTRSKSPGKKTSSKVDVKSPLDKWVIKSPRKPAILAEETQSPAKMADKALLDVCVEETPVREEPVEETVDEEAREKGTRNLFNEEEVIPDSQTIDVQPPGTPQFKKSNMAMENLPVKLSGTPVIKILKLTDSDIRSLSPSRSTRQSHNAPGSPAGGARSSRPSRRSSVVKHLTKMKSNDEGASKITLGDSEDVIPSSQGFDVKPTSQPSVEDSNKEVERSANDIVSNSADTSQLAEENKLEETQLSKSGETTSQSLLQKACDGSEDSKITNSEITVISESSQTRDADVSSQEMDDGKQLAKKRGRPKSIKGAADKSSSVESAPDAAPSRRSRRRSKVAKETASSEEPVTTETSSVVQDSIPEELTELTPCDTFAETSEKAQKSSEADTESETVTQESEMSTQSEVESQKEAEPATEESCDPLVESTFVEKKKPAVKKKERHRRTQMSLLVEAGNSQATDSVVVMDTQASVVEIPQQKRISTKKVSSIDSETQQNVDDDKNEEAPMEVDSDVTQSSVSKSESTEQEIVANPAEKTQRTKAEEKAVKKRVRGKRTSVISEKNQDSIDEKHQTIESKVEKVTIETKSAEKTPNSIITAVKEPLRNSTKLVKKDKSEKKGTLVGKTLDNIFTKECNALSDDDDDVPLGKLTKPQKDVLSNDDDDEIPLGKIIKHRQKNVPEKGKIVEIEARNVAVESSLDNTENSLDSDDVSSSQSTAPRSASKSSKIDREMKRLMVDMKSPVRLRSSGITTRPRRSLDLSQSKKKKRLSLGKAKTTPKNKDKIVSADELEKDNEKDNEKEEIAESVDETPVEKDIIASSIVDEVIMEETQEAMADDLVHESEVEKDTATTETGSENTTSHTEASSEDLTVIEAEVEVDNTENIEGSDSAVTVLEGSGPACEEVHEIIDNEPVEVKNGNEAEEVKTDFAPKSGITDSKEVSEDLKDVADKDEAEDKGEGREKSSANIVDEKEEVEGDEDGLSKFSEKIDKQRNERKQSRPQRKLVTRKDLILQKAKKMSGGYPLEPAMRARLVGSKKTSSSSPSGSSSPPVSPVSSRSFTFLKPAKQISILKLTNRRNSSGGGSSSKESGESPRSSPPAKMVAPPGSESPLFQPIQIGLYSPSASPSAGILKRRRLSGEMATNSPSPPNKQRRVSFADPEIYDDSSSPKRSPNKPVNRCLDLPKSQLPTSPLVTTTPSRVVSSQSKFITTPSKVSECQTSPSDKDASVFAVPQKTATRRKESQSQSSCASTQESQLNSTDPIIPELKECGEPVESVLPQLTSSMWVRGLGQLVRARNIRTIGHLSSLTEYEVHNLPIRSPKVSTVRKVLKTYEQQLSSKKTKETTVSLETMLEDHGKEKENEEVTADEMAAAEITTSSPVKKNLPPMEDAFATLSPGKDLDTSIEEAMNDSQELLAGITKFTEEVQENIQVDQPEGATSQSTNQNEADKQPEQISPTKSEFLSSLAKFSSQLNAESLSRLPSNEIFQAHQHLNTLMTNVVSALKTKYSSQEKK